MESYSDLAVDVGLGKHFSGDDMSDFRGLERLNPFPSERFEFHVDPHFLEKTLEGLRNGQLIWQTNQDVLTP